MAEYDGLPCGWVSAKLGDLAEYVNGRGFKTTEWETSGKPIIRIQNLTKEKSSYNYTKQEFPEKYAVKNGDLLFSWSASLGVYLWGGGDAWLNQHIFNVIPKETTSKLFVYYLLKKITSELYSKAHGSGMVHVTKGKFEDTQIQIPPLKEQHRIVQKIEELFAELDSGIAALIEAKIKLEHYKQLLLRKAFSGVLTREWREGHGKLMNDISKAYAELLELKEVNFPQRNRSRNQDICPIDPNESVALPKGWMWIKLSDLCRVTGGVTKNSKRNDLKLKRPFLRVANVYQNELRLSEMHEIGLDESELARVELKANDILFVEGNGSSDQIGRAALWDGAIPGCVHQNHLIKARSYGAVNPAYIIQFFMSEVGRRNIVNIASSTSGLYTLNITKIENLVIPYCALEEQAEVLNMLSEVNVRVNRVEKEINDSLSMAENLRQSILQKAFSGQLVPQDPSDEPASELLSRIKAEITKTKPIKKKKA